jgi:predicted 2-oxoglutarate/Fe(II)-dependent dioxygenase YbiX
MTFKISSDTKLSDLIIIQKNLIPSDICSFIIEDIEKRNWEQHTWYDNVDSSVYTNQDKELDVQSSTSNIQNILNPYIDECVTRYFLKLSENPFTVSCSSPVRFNRYKTGQKMRSHTDHIKTLFSPPEQGIPVLSMIIHLNENYTGGQLTFWDNYFPKLKTGDIILWPSIFLYPHKVTEVTSGNRYTGVVWFW